MSTLVKFNWIHEPKIFLFMLKIENWAWHNEWSASKHQDYNNHPYTTSSPRDEHKKYKITTKIDQFFKGVVQSRTKQEKSLCFILQYATINVYSNLKIKSYKRVFILLEINP